MDVAVIGGGQSGLAVGYFLRRTGLRFAILDDQKEPGGSWLHTWDSLRLFSPATFSSLPGWLMPGGPDHYPGRDEVVDYLRRYEAQYDLPVERPVKVSAVNASADGLRVETDRGVWVARAVVSATGTGSRPSPNIPAVRLFAECRSIRQITGRPSRFAGNECSSSAAGTRAHRSWRRCHEWRRPPG